MNQLAIISSFLGEQRNRYMSYKPDRVPGREIFSGAPGRGSERSGTVLPGRFFGPGPA